LGSNPVLGCVLGGYCFIKRLPPPKTACCIPALKGEFGGLKTFGGLPAALELLKRVEVFPELRLDCCSASFLNVVVRVDGALF
jgi:hypothetical protein